MKLDTYADVVKLLNDFVAKRNPQVPIDGSPHGDFWNALDQTGFLTGNVPHVKDPAGKPIRICEPGNGEGSALIQALRGSAGSLFDPDTGSISQMPSDGGPFMHKDSIDALSAWITAQPKQKSD
jgi:hypothetical protein